MTDFAAQRAEQRRLRYLAKKRRPKKWADPPIWVDVECDRCGSEIVRPVNPKILAHRCLGCRVRERMELEQSPPGAC